MTQTAVISSHRDPQQHAQAPVRRPSFKVPKPRTPGKARVCKKTDHALGVGANFGKSAVEGGLAGITGALNKTHSEPYIRTQPHGWHASRYKNEIEYAQHLDRTRKDTIHRNPSITLHANVQGDRWVGVPDHIPSPDNPKYNPSHHQWYHAVTRQRSSPIVGPSPAEVTRKARDHIGYGSGTISYGDIQGTAISDETPSWFVGIRMVPGPGDVPRCPKVDVFDGRLQVNYRRYEKGPNLSTIETDNFISQSGQTPKKSFRTPRFDNWKEYDRNLKNGFKCVHGFNTCDRAPCEDKKKNGDSTIKHGGCQVQKPFYPIADMVTLDPAYVHRTPTEAINRAAEGRVRDYLTFNRIPHTGQ